mmetsp:Transcript_5599/g.15651  ORF Transcript_5599/g.15651 Transcript_5599/m.15651 type:complete len:221 (-) Transcript_5599:261-923(-)
MCVILDRHTRRCHPLLLLCLDVHGERGDGAGREPVQLACLRRRAALWSRGIEGIIGGARRKGLLRSAVVNYELPAFLWGHGQVDVPMAAFVGVSKELEEVRVPGEADVRARSCAGLVRVVVVVAPRGGNEVEIAAQDEFTDRVDPAPPARAPVFAGGCGHGVRNAAWRPGRRRGMEHVAGRRTGHLLAGVEIFRGGRHPPHRRRARARDGNVNAVHGWCC